MTEEEMAHHIELLEADNHSLTEKIRQLEQSVKYQDGERQKFASRSAAYKELYTDTLRRLDPDAEPKDLR